MSKRVENDEIRKPAPSPYGYGGAYGYGAAPDTRAKDVGKGKSKKNKKLSPEKKERLKEQNKTLRARQAYALQNVEYRKKVEQVNGIKGADNSIYHLEKDKKPKKQKDHFFIMRKGVCFFMFLFMLICVAVFALGFVKLPDSIGKIITPYTSLYVESEAKTTETASASGDMLLAENTTTEETAAEEAKGPTASYTPTDPIFGFVKHVSGMLGKEVSLGDSPLYDAMLAKAEMGMTDTVAGILLEWAPAFMILYIIIALVMFIKAFCGMFGKRMFKNFGLGAILMIVCMAAELMAGLAFQTDLTAKLNYGGVVNVLIGYITGTGGFTAGYGMLILIALPLLTLILSMFCRKKIPYSIFDR